MQHRSSCEGMLAGCLQGFGQMLYAALMVHFKDLGCYVSDGQYLCPEQRRNKIYYPGAVTTTIQKLMQSSQDCIDFVTRLYYANDHSQGSAYFFSYNFNTSLSPWKATAKMSWKILLPLCLVRPLVKSFLFQIVSRTEREKNRACMYFLDIPVICSLDKEYEILRELVEVHERNEGQRRVRPRSTGLTLGETNLKFTPYDCCSFQGERDVHLGSLLRIFRPLRVLEKHAQALFPTLSTCNRGTCGVESYSRNFTYYVLHKRTETLKSLLTSVEHMDTVDQVMLILVLTVLELFFAIFGFIFVYVNTVVRVLLRKV